MPNPRPASALTRNWLHRRGKNAPKDLELFIPAGPRLGDIVIEADNLSKGYGERLLFEGMNFKLPRGGIVGIIGPNGAGKTTLFRMITGSEQPDSGTIRIGETVQLAYVDQSRDTLNPDRLLWEEIADGQEMIQLGKQTINARNYVARFNFTGGDQQKRWACSPAVNATGSTWQKCSKAAPTSCFWTNRPTIWM